MAEQFSRGHKIIAWGTFAAVLPLPLLVLGAAALLDPPRALQFFGLLLSYCVFILFHGARVIPGLVALVGLMAGTKYPVVCVVGTPIAAFLVYGVEEIIDWRRDKRTINGLLIGLSLPVSALSGLSFALLGVFINTTK